MVSQVFLLNIPLAIRASDLLMALVLFQLRHWNGLVANVANLDPPHAVDHVMTSAAEGTNEQTKTNDNERSYSVFSSNFSRPSGHSMLAVSTAAVMLTVGWLYCGQHASEDLLNAWSTSPGGAQGWKPAGEAAAAGDDGLPSARR